jgi:hypothetical protein
MECKVKEEQTRPLFFVLSLVYLHGAVCVGVHLIELRTCEEGLFQGGELVALSANERLMPDKRTRKLVPSSIIHSSFYFYPKLLYI